MTQDIVDIDCGSVFTIAQTMDIYSQLSVVYEEQKTVSIDISQVERVDSAALQLLYSFQRDAQAKQLVVVWSEPSHVFSNAVDILGMPAFYVTQ